MGSGGRNKGRERLPDAFRGAHEGLAGGGAIVDDRTGFLRDECPGREVPLVEATFVVGVDAAACERAEVDRRAAETADVANCREDVDQCFGLGPATIGVVREAGRDQRSGQVFLRAGVYGSAVERGASAARRPETFVAYEIVHHSRHIDAVGSRRHGDRTAGEVVDEVCRAIDRVDQPDHAGGAGDCRPLLADEAVVGPGCGDCLDDGALCPTVEFGYEIGLARLGVDTEVVESPRVAEAGDHQIDGRIGNGEKPAGVETHVVPSAWARSRASFAFHSAIARNASTATIATPIAHPIALINPTTPAWVAQPSVQEMSVTAKPMRPPHKPAISIATMARILARSGGAAVVDGVGRPSSGGVDEDAGATPRAYRGPEGVTAPFAALECPTMRALVVLPTYDEAANIEEVLRRLRDACPKASVLVVDDSSPDGTAQLAEKIAEELGEVEVLRRPAKSGLGSAYRDGFKHGLVNGFDIMVEMDSDLSHDPAALPVLLEMVEAGTDLVIGSRYVPGGSIPAWSWYRRALSKWGNRYAAGMLGIDIRDATSGYRAYSASALAAIDFQTVRADGYGFQIEMAHRVLQTGGSVAEVPIQFVDRVRGTSKMSGRIVAEALVLVSWWGIRDRLLRFRR